VGFVTKKLVLSSKRSQRLLKEGFWIILGQAAATIGSLVGVRLLTELLNPIQYGELALGMTIATLVNQVVLGPLGQGVLRFYAPAVELDEIGSYLSAVRRITFFAIIVIGAFIVIGVIGLEITKQSFRLPIFVMALAFATATGCNAILSGIQNAARQRAVVALHQGLEAWARFFIATALIAWLGASSSLALFGYVISSLLVLTSQWLYFRKALPHSRRIQPEQKNKWHEKIWHYSCPFTIWGIVTWGQLVSDRWALELFSTTQQVGMYAVLFQLGYYPISLATSMAIQFLQPILFQMAGDASDAQRNAHVSDLSWQLAGFSLGLTGIVFGITLLFYRQIFGVFASGEYAQVAYLLPWMVVAGGVSAAAQTISLDFLSQTRTSLMMRVKITTSFVGVTLNFFGAFYYGVGGIVGASVIFSVFYCIWMISLSKIERIKRKSVVNKN
jgi:O-antigen/teichoic acid export membrane protein